ncbi:MAG: hypothetical protein ACI8R4_001495 [Paracoccaceae bacterium]|jgi:hypothetical protein
MRFAALVLFLIPNIGIADSFSPASKITDVIVYPDSAAITRKAPFSIPAGQHTLILRDLPAMDDPLSLRIQAVEDDASHARLMAKVAHTRLAFLQQLGRDDKMSTAPLDDLRALSQMVGTEALDAHQSALTAEIAARKIERALEDLQEELAKAQQALDAVSQEDEDRIYLSVEVTAEAPADGTVILSYLSENGSFWAPIYDLHLTRGAEPSVRIQRDVLVAQESGENWVDINLTLSTLEPFGRIRPFKVRTDRKRIEDPPPRPS